MPSTNTLNLAAGITRANNAIVPLASDGSGTMNARAVLGGSSDTVHLIVDVSGYFE